MRGRLLALLKEDAFLTVEQLATMLDVDEETVRKEIKICEEEGIIKGYQTIINWEKLSQREVCAVIELKVTPKKETGFEEIAKEIMMFDEVESVYLMAGTYDFLIMIRGSDIQEVSRFVSQRLSTLPSVLATATHFVLKRHKDHHIIMDTDTETERRNLIS